MCEEPIQFNPSVYEIRVSGRLSTELADWLGSLSLVIAQPACGSTITVLRVPVADQSALFGILARIRDLGLKLISVNREGFGEDAQTEKNEVR